MARVYENWDRLVRSTLKREQLRNAGQGPERASSGIAGSVPVSLGKTTNIDLILQAADEIQAENPNVARILCDQAYSMAQNLDPNSDGRGVLQFKTGLMSVIKQKLAKKDGAQIDRNRDVDQLWEFYQLYKRRHRVDDIQREEQKWQDSGTLGANRSELETRSSEMKKVFANLWALIDVMESLGKESSSDGVEKLITEELRRIKGSNEKLASIVYENWDRLVRSTLKREQLRNAGQGAERASSGIAGSVSVSLGKTTNIDLILQAADEIQAENPNVARILCDQAYSMAQNLDPNSDGRGVLQFKTGLMSVIKQKLAKKDGARIDRNRDVVQLWEFYQLYKRRHSVDDIQREEQKWQDSGTLGANRSELETRSSEMKKVFANLRALIDVMESHRKDSSSDGVGKLITEELRRIKGSNEKLPAELIPYNIVLLDLK